MIITLDIIAEPLRWHGGYIFLIKCDHKIIYEGHGLYISIF